MTEPGATAQRPQLSRSVLAHVPRQPGSWLTWDVGQNMTTDSIPKVRVYTPGQICLACAIGGPPATTWMIARNFRIFQDRKKEKLSFLYGVLACVALIGIGAVMPKGSSGTVLGGIVAGLSREIAKRQQGPQIEDYQAKGGEKGSWWKAAGIGLVSLIIILCVIFAVVLVVS